MAQVLTMIGNTNIRETLAGVRDGNHVGIRMIATTTLEELEGPTEALDVSPQRMVSDLISAIEDVMRAFPKGINLDNKPLLNGKKSSLPTLRQRLAKIAKR
jgi:hypothetical protein